MKGTKFKIIISAGCLLIIFRLILPFIMLQYINGALTNLKGYYGHVDDIDLSLYRGAYIIDNIYLDKIDNTTNKPVPFFKSENIDLSLEWKALFHGSVVGKLTFHSPSLFFTKDKAEFGEVRKDSSNFRTLLNAFMPLKINRFEVHNGAVHYKDNTSKPEVDVSLKRAHILAFNLTNIINPKLELPSRITAQASAYEGDLNFNMKLNALAENATFDLNVEMKKTNLTLFNDFFKAYGKFDVSKGRFGLYMEMAAKDGDFKGYVKPIITDLIIVGPQDRDDSVLQKIWEHIVGGMGVVLKNQRKNQLATKIPIEGKFNNPKINTIDAIWEVLRNAFIQALIPGIDNAINIGSVK